ncbi:MAG: TetR/AcrR family transcriptional regulator [Acidimicrobiia bacterium]
MTGRVNRQPRGYDGSRRRAAAEARRNEIFDAAFTLFVERGYAATTMAAIAERAGVAVDTVYASAGTKPALLMALNDLAVTGSTTTSTATIDDADFVRAITAEPDAARKLERYAEAVARIRPRQVPLYLVVREAAVADPEIATHWAEGTERRARNLGRFADQLAATGRLRPGLDAETVRDIVWATSSPEMWVQLVNERGWTAEHFSRWLADTWITTLLMR